MSDAVEITPEAEALIRSEGKRLRIGTDDADIKPGLMMDLIDTAVDSQVERCYASAVGVDSMHIPYLFGGNTLKGLDCSKADSWVLKAGGILSRLMGTRELGSTSELANGIGQFMTIWVADTMLLEHSTLEFDMPGKGRQFWTARKSGTTVGFYTLEGGRDYLSAAGFKPRRRP